MPTHLLDVDALAPARPHQAEGVSARCSLAAFRLQPFEAAMIRKFIQWNLKRPTAFLIMMTLIAYAIAAYSMITT